VANQAAHYLSKFALTSNSDVVWIEEDPPCISEVVAFDLFLSIQKKKEKKYMRFF